MNSSIVRWIVSTSLTGALVLALAGSWLAWRLRQGPLAVPMIDGYVAQAFAGRDPDLEATFAGTVLVWAPERRLPELRVLGLRLVRRGGPVVAQFPELAIRPSARALVRGRIAVGAVGFTGVKLALARDAEGRVSLAGLKPADADPDAPSPLAWLVQPTDPDAPNAYLRRISIRDSEIALDDRLSTSKWRATGTDLELVRRGPGIHADLEAELAATTEAGAFRLPLRAHAEISFGEGTALAAVSFKATAASGQFDPAGEAHPSMPIGAIEVEGGYAADDDTLEVGSFRLKSDRTAIDAAGTIALRTREAKFKGAVAELPVERLDLVWPSGAAPAARRWVLGNLRDGRIRKGAFSVDRASGDRHRTDFRMTADVAGMTVDYLHPLPALTGVDGSVTIDEKTVRAEVTAGAAGALVLGKAGLVIDLQSTPVAAAVEADVEGPTDDLLAFLDSPPLGYPSRFGVPANGVGGRTSGHLTLRFPLGDQASASRLEVEARANLHGEEATGTLAASVAGGELRKLAVESFRSARNDFTASVARDGDGGYRVTIVGAKLDIAPLIERMQSKSSASPAIERPFDVDFDLARVAAANGIEWTAVRGAVSGDGGRVTRLDASGTFGGGGSTKLTVEPVPDGRLWRATSDDAGRVLQAFGLIENAKGGRLELTATTDDRTPDRKSTGRLEASDVRIVKAPFLARIFSLASLDGIADAFRNDGIAFRRVRLPFAWTKDRITVTDARAIGAIGLTGDGTIDLATGKIDVRGQVIPAYTLNTALGKVPWIGELFTGGEGGGLFGISYRVKGTRSAPDVSVNPLTALAPGKLREMFVTPFGL